MLTLTRKPGESIHINDDVEIVVKEIRGGAVRIGVQAPASVGIYRGELYRKMRESGETPRHGANVGKPPAEVGDSEETATRRGGAH